MFLNIECPRNFAKQPIRRHEWRFTLTKHATHNVQIKLYKRRGQLNKSLVSFGIKMPYGRTIKKSNEPGVNYMNNLANNSKLVNASFFRNMQ